MNDPTVLQLHGKLEHIFWIYCSGTSESLAYSTYEQKQTLCSAALAVCVCISCSDSTCVLVQMMRKKLGFVRDKQKYKYIL